MRYPHSKMAILKVHYGLLQFYRVISLIFEDYVCTWCLSSWTKRSWEAQVLQSWGHYPTYHRISKSICWINISLWYLRGYTNWGFFTAVGIFMDWSTRGIINRKEIQSEFLYSGSFQFRRRKLCTKSLLLGDVLWTWRGGERGDTAGKTSPGRLDSGVRELGREYF